jgi:hypothetical protein
MMPLEQRPHSLSLLCTAAVTAANLVSAGGFEGEGCQNANASILSVYPVCISFIDS